jgi:hypothetical protein
MTDKECVRPTDAKGPAVSSGATAKDGRRPKGKKLLRKLAKKTPSGSALESGPAKPFECECSHCGTIIEFDSDRCPVCGAQLDDGDTSIVHLFEGMDFDGDSLIEADCPYCSDHVSLMSGKCTSCGKEVLTEDPGDPDKKVTPVVRGDNVVFPHPDVETGELNYLQKMHKMGMQSVTLHIEGSGREECGDDSHGLSRT